MLNVYGMRITLYLIYIKNINENANNIITESKTISVEIVGGTHPMK